MQITELYIENFREIKSLTLPLGPLNVLIGENNSGKSTIIEAIRIALSPGLGSRRGRQFSEYDFHLADKDASPNTCAPIIIQLHFSENVPDEWSDEILQQLEGVTQPDLTTGIQNVLLQIRGCFNTDRGGHLLQDWPYFSTHSS